MDKKSAQQLIENTFNAKFDESKFTLFIKNFLNDLELKSNSYSGNLLWDDYKEHINSYKRIGKYTDPEGDALDVLIVQVKTVTKLQKARTTLRNFVIKHLSKFDKDYALVAFYSKEDGGADWRFSFIKLEHQSYLDEEKQKVKIRKEFTPAKRYSFLVGEYEDSHTAKNQLLPLLQNIASNPTLEELETAFSIEKVTDEFFGQYKDLFIKLSTHFENDEHVKAELKKANIENSRFTKKLLGQIVFLYFLQKKGWLGVPEKETWGKGDKRFIQNLYKQANENNQNYFKDYLQPLFYEALAKERNNENSFYEKFNCRIPFLNGGLFEAEYNWQKANISIPEYLFRNKDKNKAGDTGTGVLDVFDRYNFTIKEDEPLDKEVAVDPEMLGKVFENMLDITERKSKGAFYTPREIVHYMCQESLIHYLDNSLENKIKKADIETYIRKGHFALENDQRVANKGESKTYKYIIPESIRQNAELIDQKLSEIKILDPAIGSGAFPVGLLHELVNAQLVIKPHFSDKYTQEKLLDFGFNANETSISESRYIYRLKRHIIQNSIYGVDIDASAIDIARLRLWLSLVVDEEDVDDIETLPNLDYKIVCGNSLISRYDIDMPIEKVFKEFNKDRDDKMDLDKYKALVNAFMDESDHDKKEEFRTLIAEIKSAFKTYLSLGEKLKLDKLKEKLKGFSNNLFSDTKTPAEKKRIKELKEKITKQEKEHSDIEQAKIYENAIEWRFEFPNLLNDNGDFVGFDVVIGNPPYVSISKVDYKNIFKVVNYETYASTGDLYVIFYEKGYQILKPKGNLNLITSNKWINASYGSKTRKFFAEKTSPQILIDFARIRIFPNATVFVNILMLEKNNPTGKVQAVAVQGNHIPQISLSSYFENNKINLSIQEDEIWKISSLKGLEINSAIEKAGTPLIDWEKIEFFRGITTGFNKAFHVNLETKNKILSEEPKSQEYTYPLLRGKDIKRWGYAFEDWYMFFIPWHFPLHNDYTIGTASIKAEASFKKEYPKLYNHLEDYYSELSGRNKDETGKRYEWYALQRYGANYWKEFLKSKIVWIEISDKANFSFDKEGHFLTNSAYFISGKNLSYLIAVLNSSIFDYYFFQITAKIAGGRKRYTKQYVEKVPIPQISKKEQLPYELLVDYVISSKSLSDELIFNFFEQLLDAIVFELYFPDELKSANKEILKHLGDLKPITDDMSEEEKLAIIQSEFERLYDPNHPVRNNIETLDSIEEVRIIKEALK